jgi:glycosyltransferase involved in cell wall biosynthesis
MKPARTVSIIIPVYNEERTVEAILRKVHAARLPEGMNREIVIVNDASTDGTRAIISRLSKELSLRVFDQTPNQGKGAAVKRGLRESSGDFTLIQDADLEYDPADYVALLAPLAKGEVDAVFGSRYMGKRMRDLFSVNYVANRILTATSNMFTGFALTDMETCYKAFTKPATRMVAEELTAKRFDMEPEITTIMARGKFRIVEVPISYDPRTAREGKKIKWTDGFPALISIIKTGAPGLWQARRWAVVFSLSLVALVALFAVFLGPNELGDTPTYIAAVDVLKGGAPAVSFVPNRLLTTPLPLLFISLFGDPYLGWFFMNALLFMLASIFFWKLLVQVFKSGPVAYLGALLLSANYGFLVFSLNFSMDIGGWAFYIFSLYLLWRYAHTKRVGYIFGSAVMIGIGGLFKEYGFLGAVAIAAYLITEVSLRKISLTSFIKRAIGTAAIALLPTIILYLVIYLKFDYTYADWLGSNSEYYVYASRIKEFIKALGSLHNVLGLLALGGVWAFWKARREVATETKTFLFAALVSCLPIFFWPAITQRILVPTVPIAILFAGFLFKRFERWAYVFLPVIALYILATFFMDSFILGAVNLPF